jgi:hypothetical protein
MITDEIQGGLFDLKEQFHRQAYGEPNKFVVHPNIYKKLAQTYSQNTDIKPGTNKMVFAGIDLCTDSSVPTNTIYAIGKDVDNMALKIDTGTWNTATEDKPQWRKPTPDEYIADLKKEIKRVEDAEAKKKAVEKARKAAAKKAAADKEIGLKALRDEAKNGKGDARVEAARLLAKVDIY